MRKASHSVPQSDQITKSVGDLDDAINIQDRVSAILVCIAAACEQISDPGWQTP